MNSPSYIAPDAGFAGTPYQAKRDGNHARNIFSILGFILSLVVILLNIYTFFWYTWGYWVLSYTPIFLNLLALVVSSIGTSSQLEGLGIAGLSFSIIGVAMNSYIFFGY